MLFRSVVMALVTCGIGNGDKVFHYRMHVESDLLGGNYADALRVGENDAATDSSLTMLRIATLSSTGQLGERLFTYPLTGRSDVMLPNGSSVRLAMVPEVWLYKKIGVVFKEKVSPRRYLELAHEKGYAKREAHDWLLTAYLDRKSVV